MGWWINKRKVKGYKDIVNSDRYIYIKYETPNGTGTFIFKEMYMILHKRLFEKRFKECVITKWAVMYFKKDHLIIEHKIGYMGLGRITL